MRLVLAAFWITCTLAVAHAQTVSGPARVIDGDTLEVAGQRFRLHGIDAPESRQTCRRQNESWACGAAATAFLRQLVGQDPVSCKARERDRYGRIVGVCLVRRTEINAALVAAGLALAYRQYSTDYVPAENAAKEARQGLWAGEFVAPWDWRRGARLAGEGAATAQAGDCRIKGNINSKGERIYHVPGSRWYVRTTIDESKGERWFCSEDEARFSGWREPKR